MGKLSRNAIIGYPAGIITGITYGLNPLFGMPLMSKGVSIESILFFRYGIAVALLGLFLILQKTKFPTLVETSRNNVDFGLSLHCEQCFSV